MITLKDKIHLKCNCLDFSFNNGIREQILFSSNFNARPGYKIIGQITTFLYKTINKTRLDNIQLFLEEANHNSVYFKNQSLTFTIQIIMIYSNCEG